MKMRSEWKRHRFCLLLMMPLCVYVLGFTLGPSIYTVVLSLTEKTTGTFPFWQNYVRIFDHFQFREAIVNTLAITMISLTLELGAGLFLAVLLTQRFIGKGLMRALMLLPLGVPTIVSAANMRYLFDSQGYINGILMRLHLIASPIDWTGGGWLSVVTIALADMWKVTPLVMLILLAGLESIPLSLYEMAQVDGATFTKRFRYITLPLLKPFIIIAMVVRGIDAFRLFELPLTLGGSTTPVISTYTYFEYFQYNDPHTAAASAVILLLIIMVTVGFYLKAMKMNRV